MRKALSSKNPKAVWNTINRILNKQHKRIKHNPSEMNKHFSNLAANLTNKENKESDYDTLIRNLPVNNCEQSFNIQHTTYSDVYKIITSLKNDCSSGFDDIPIRYIKPVAEYMVSPMVHIINRSIDQNVFPNLWKIARVCPIPKTDHPTNVKEYRPISILPVLSKIYERVILSQLCTFIESSTIYNTTQSGFRKGHSTTTMLLKMRDDIRKAMNKSEVTLSVLIDYSKAFDTIDHCILLEKLQKMNFSNNSIEIICSYLMDRQQYVQIEDSKSTLLPMFFGVPQGSILGPVLFNLYVAELADQINSATIQYADDATVYRHCKIKDLNECIKEIENDVTQLSSWSYNNSLIFNSNKLQYILFSSQRLCSKSKLGNDYSFLIRCSGKSIEQKASVKLLGIIFDQHLSWTDQINNIIKSAHATLRALKRFRRFTPMNVRKTLAEALVLSKMNYCNVVFGQIPKYLVSRLQRMQNTTAGYVCGRYATITDVVQLNWLPVKEHIEFSTVKLVHQSLHNKLWPKYLQVKTAEHRRNLRSSEQEPNITHGDTNTFQEQATIYNELPQKIQKIENYKIFINEVKGFYKDKALARALTL